MVSREREREQGCNNRRKRAVEVVDDDESSEVGDESQQQQQPQRKKKRRTLGDDREVFGTYEENEDAWERVLTSEERKLERDAQRNAQNRENTQQRKAVRNCLLVDFFRHSLQHCPHGYCTFILIDCNKWSTRRRIDGRRQLNHLLQQPRGIRQNDAVSTNLQQISATSMIKL